MSKTRFYIFRHGETFATLHKNPQRFGAVQAYGRKLFSASILEEGKPAILRLGEFLKVRSTDFNACSQFKRCKETAQIVTDITGKGFVYDKRLNEIVFETVGHLKNRVKSFLDFVEEHEYKNVAICTHGGVIAVLKNLILKGEYNWGVRNDYPGPGVLIIIEDGEYKEIDFRK